MQESIRLTSLQNPLVKEWRTLNRLKAARINSGRYLAEGEHMAQEALQEKCAAALLCEEGKTERFSALLQAAFDQNLPVYVLSNAIVQALCDAKTPQGVFALCALPTLLKADEAPDLIVALDDVQDPGNVGTIIRTLDAIGHCQLVLSQGCADAYSPKALRASMGGIFRVPVFSVACLPEYLETLQQQRFQILAGALDGAPFYETSLDPACVCLVIGNEGAGISEKVMACATNKVKLPMCGGAESLNAAVACAVMAYDIIRRRGAK